jgi:sulfur relay protein TusC/DsrF
MYLNRKAPYGTIYAWESLEVVLIGAAFDQDVSLAFVDDGVYQLIKGQDTAGIGMKNFSPTYRTGRLRGQENLRRAGLAGRARSHPGRPPAPGLGGRDED